MAFQTTINTLLGYGVPGEIAFDGPTRAEPTLVNSNGASPNTFGFAFTKSASTNIAQVGGTITPGTTVFAGILVRPKEHVRYGTLGVADAGAFAVPDNTECTLLTMGEIFAVTNSAGNIGDLVVYDTTTGALSTVAAGSAAAGTGKAFVPNAVLTRTAVTAPCTVTIRLTN